MGIINLFLNYIKIKRAIQIISVIIKHSTKTLFAELTFVFRNRKKRQKHIYSAPERLRMITEELGPTYIKFGQILADRPDVIPERFRKELKKLQSKAEPFSSEQAISIIETELNKKIERVFSTFDRVPIAAASIGQVYRGTLRKGKKEVVIKIQRPFIENKIKIDIYLMRYLGKLFTRQNPELRSLNIVGLIDEFSKNIVDELDYNIEASNIKMFYSLFENDPQIKIPYVYDKYTTKRLIIIEYLEGTPPDNHEGIAEMKLDKNIIVNNGAKAVFRMILEFGVFHADPHSGNIILQKDNVVGFIDFGMIGILRAREIDFIADYTIGFAKNNHELIGQAVLDLCGIKYMDEKEDMLFDIKRMIMHNYTDNALDIANFSRTLQDSINVVVKYQLVIPSGIFMLLKALITLEKFSEELGVEIDMAEIILPYSKRIHKERYSAKKSMNNFKDTLKTYVNLFNNGPRDISEILYKLKAGKIKHDIKLEDESAFSRIARMISLRISYVILLIGLFIGSSILITLGYEENFGYFILYSTSFLILFLLIRWIFIKRH